jgi:Fe-S cluster assembly ATP-binding protein
MLKIKNLTVTSEQEEVLQDISLEVNKNEIHAFIGPSKSGKTALVYALAGLPYVEVTEGSILYKNKKLLKQTIDERSLNGIYTVFQNPVELTHITNWELMQVILENRGEAITDTHIEHYNFLTKQLGLSTSHGDRPADSDGMDWSEAIKNELLMMFMMDPSLAIIDAVDEKLSPEDIEIVIANIKEFAHRGERATLIFSRNIELLKAIEPTHVHVIVDGIITLSGSADLLQRIEEDGYSELSTS